MLNLHGFILDLLGVDGRPWGGRMEEGATQEVKRHHSGEHQKAVMHDIIYNCWRNITRIYNIWIKHAYIYELISRLKLHMWFTITLMFTLHMIRIYAHCNFSFPIFTPPSARCEVDIQARRCWQKWLGLPKCKFPQNSCLYNPICKKCASIVHTLWCK